MTETQKQKVQQRIAEAKEKKLTTLDLRNCGLGEIPDEVFELTHLEHLYLGAEVKKEWTRAGYLHRSVFRMYWYWEEKSLYFHSNYISEVPHKIKNLTNLKSLDLSFNAFWNFPRHITGLIALTTLNLSYNQLSQFPDSITQLTNLSSLSLSSNNLSQLPSPITQLPNLTSLYLSSNNLSQLPNSTTQLSNLTSLYLSSNNLLQLPDSITQLSNLTSLDLSSNNLLELSDSITQLSNLTSLNLRSNNLLELSDSITQLSNLTSLNLSSNNLSQLPDSITQLSNLTSLNLRDNKLSQLPDSITQLSNLTSLDLSSNKLSQLPDSITQLSNLTSLDLSSNKLSQLPDSITQLANLTSLCLHSNKLFQLPNSITQLPNSITQLSNLTSLDLRSNQFSQFPDSITQLSNLTSLYLSYNNLLELPDSITQLSNLTSLDLSSNNFSQLPNSITQLSNLTSLDLSSNNLSQLPDSITQLSNLTSLYLSSNNFSQLPNSITQLSNLTSLDLSSNNFSQLPNSITQLSNLTSLYLSYNKLSQLPNSITQLSNLTSLYLSSNNLSQLPNSITQLSNLTSLYLSYNKLSQLPDSITQLSNLTSLDLRDNNFSQLPDSITQLSNLTSLDLSSNQLSQLPDSITQLRKLKTLWLDSNPIETPPPEIINGGINTIFNYFAELKISEVDHIYEAKLLIVGEERAGKTSLMKSLTNPEYILEDEKSTEGIDIQTWYISKDKTGFEKDFRLNTWDFGGQEIYHATHQFFLSKRSVYLLVTEPRKDVRQEDFYYWFNIIQSLGKNSPVILVQNKCDQNLEDLPVREYKKQFTNITGDFIRTSCKPDKKDTIINLQNFIAQIVQNKDLLPHIGDKLPKVWVDIRQEIAKLQKKNAPQIPYQTYLNICKDKEYDMDAERASFLADFFHDLGVFLHFKDNLKLKKTVFLDNEWVTHGVYEALDSPTVIENEGKFSQQDLVKFWKGKPYDGWEDEFIELMQEFKICYELRGKKKHYLAPHRLPKDVPEKLEEKLQKWGATDNLHFEYRYEFMPKGMLSRFIVERHHYICENYQWRYGALLEIDNTFALVKEDYFKRKITIRLKGGIKRNALERIRDTFEEIHKEFKDLAVEEMVSCICRSCKESTKPHFFSRKTLENHFEKDTIQARCDISSEEVSIVSLLKDIDSKFKNTPIKLTGEQFGQLTKALAAAFRKKKRLARMVRVHFNQYLRHFQS